MREKLKAISLRQPWAEEVIRGNKPIEYRGRPTKMRGRIYIYASLGRWPAEDEATFAAEIGYDVASLPRGVLIGTVEIVDCEQLDPGEYAWRLANPQRLPRPLEPQQRPQPIWFHPFGRAAL